VGITYFFSSSPQPSPLPPKASAAADGTNDATRPSSEPEREPVIESPECTSLVRDGECENNESFMRKACPHSCAAHFERQRTNKEASKRTSKPAYNGPPDADANCRIWASSGECDNNPRFMLEKCAQSCNEANQVVDIHQDCASWVQDGECFRNPAFMLQQCRASCAAFAENNAGMLQDTSDTCVSFALNGGCDTDINKASTQCRASCHIQRICGNHTETVYCQKALRCEAIADKQDDCEARAMAGECESKPTSMLKSCLKACSEIDLPGMMRFHLPHVRTTLSRFIDLPGSPPPLGGFYSTPPQHTPESDEARKICRRWPAQSFGARMLTRREALLDSGPWSRRHWAKWQFAPGRERTPRVPHRFDSFPADEGSSRSVVVQHIAYSPRIRYIHRLLTPEECQRIIEIAMPLFSRSPVRGSVTRVRTSTTAMLGGAISRDPTVQAVRHRIARFSGYAEPLIEPLQVVRYQQGQKYEGHHDFFDVCDISDKAASGRRQVTFLIYLLGMPEGETGGGTGFPELKLEVAPEQGSAIVFNDCHDNGEEDSRSLHQGLPPIKPDTVKLAINGWIRSHRVGHMNF